MNRLILEAKRKEIITVLYPIPEFLDSEEEDLRSRHEDLPSMTKAELIREHVRLKWRLQFDDNPHQWLIQREEQLRMLIHNVKHGE